MMAGEGHQAKKGAEGREVVKSMVGGGVAGGNRMGTGENVATTEAL